MDDGTVYIAVGRRRRVLKKFFARESIERRLPDVADHAKIPDLLRVCKQVTPACFDGEVCQWRATMGQIRMKYPLVLTVSKPAAAVLKARARSHRDMAGRWVRNTIQNENPAATGRVDTFYKRHPIARL